MSTTILPYSQKMLNGSVLTPFPNPSKVVDHTISAPVQNMLGKGMNFSSVWPTFKDSFLSVFPFIHMHFIWNWNYIMLPLAVFLLFAVIFVYHNFLR